MDGDGQLLHLAKELKELCKCNKCQKELEPPMSHCTSGHDICSQCKGSRPTCPLCSAGFAVSSKLIEQVFKLLPKPCKYSDRGCSYVSVSGRHEPICEFRTIKCRVGEDNECTWSGTVKDWMEHVESEHRQQIVRNGSEIEIGKKFGIDFKLQWNFNCFYLKLDSKVFLFFMLKHRREVYYAARYVPVESAKDEYLLKVTCLGSSWAFHICAVKVTVLEGSELLEDLCKPFGVFIDELGLTRSPRTLKFELIKSKLI